MLIQSVPTRSTGVDSEWWSVPPSLWGAGMSQELPLQFTPRLGSTAPNQQFRVKICETHRYQTVRPFTVLALSGLEHL